MKLLLCLAALVGASTAVGLEYIFPGVSEMADVDSGTVKLSGGSHGGCHCCRHGCWCDGMDDGVRVSVVLMYDELPPSDKNKPVVVGRFMIGKYSFEKIWCVNKVQTFCRYERYKRFCFNVDVNDLKKGEKELNGCIRMTYPKKVPLGCFKLPLLASPSAMPEDSEEDFDVKSTLLEY